MFRPDLESSTGPGSGRMARERESIAQDPLLSRIARIVDPGRQPGSYFTFRLAPSADGSVAWEAWLEGVFRPTILPHFIHVMELAARSHGREISVLDRQLDEVLPSDSRGPSRAAGLRLLGALAEAQGIRMVNKWTLWARGGEMPVHFATMYAAQCAIFSFPVRQSVLAYLQMEWQAATMNKASMEQVRNFQGSMERVGVLVDELLAARMRLVILSQATTQQAVS